MDASSLLPETIDTERLLIRTARPGDGAVLNRAVRESLVSLAPWLRWVSPTPTLEQSEVDCTRAYARFLLNEDLVAFLFLRDTGELIGGSGLHKANWQTRSFEVGYWGRTGFGGRGLVTEGVRALVNHAFQVLRANRVFLTTDERNEASCRLAERVGFQLEGTLRSERFDVAGRLSNTRVYGRVAPQDDAEAGARRGGTSLAHGLPQP